MLMLAKYLLIGMVIWGGGPPECGTPEIQWRETIVVGVEFYSPGYQDGTELAGISILDKCVIILSHSIWRRTTRNQHCNLIAHEMGHFKLPGADPYHHVPGMEAGHRFRLCTVLFKR